MVTLSDDEDKAGEEEQEVITLQKSEDEDKTEEEQEVICLHELVTLQESESEEDKDDGLKLTCPLHHHQSLHHHNPRRIPHQPQHLGRR